MITDDQLEQLIEDKINEALGSLLTVGQPAPVGLATPTGFGLLETDFTSGAPIATLKSGFVPQVVGADVGNSTITLASTGLVQPVNAGEAWELFAELYIGSAAAATGGLNVELVTPAASIARVGLFGPFSTGSTFFQQVIGRNVLSTSFCNFDASAGDQKLTISASFVFTGPGTIDIQFRAGTATNNYIVRAGSFAWFKRAV